MASGFPEPNLRQLREQVLSTIYTSAAHPATPETAAASNSPQTPRPDTLQHSPVTPANPGNPAAHGGSATLSRPPAPWTHAAGSPVPWGIPQGPENAERRYAELEAARLSALAIQNRQTETIRRLAAQLARAERLERSKDRMHEEAVQRSTPRRKKKPSPRQDWAQREESSACEDDDDHRDIPVERGSERMHRKAVSSSARHSHVRSKHGASSSKRPPSRSRSAAKGVSWPSEGKARPKSKTKPAVKLATDDDPDFLAVRRKVLSLDNAETLEEENASLREENASAKEDAKLFKSYVADIRQSFSSILADREEMMSLIQLLRPRNEREKKEAGVEAELPPAEAEVQAEARRREEPIAAGISTPEKESFTGRHPSPTDVQFPGFETPTPCRPGPRRGEDSSAKELTGAFVEAEATPSMENELRAELRMVLEENAALSERVSELENAADLEEDVKIFPQTTNGVEVDGIALQDLRTEILVLASVADCLRFDIGEGCTQSQATITHCGEGSTAKLAVAFNLADSDAAPAEKYDVKQLVCEIADVRKTLAVKYGEWLSMAPLLRHKASRYCEEQSLDFSSTGFEAEISEDSGSWKESTLAHTVTKSMERK